MHRSSTLNVIMLRALIVILAGHLLTIASPVTETTKPPTLEPTVKSVCSSPACIEMSEMIRSNMNTSFNPCDDFYAYTCGNFAVKNKIPDDKSRYTSYDVIEDEVKKLMVGELSKPGSPTEASPLKYIRKFYQECSNQDNLKRGDLSPIDDLVNELAGVEKTKEQVITSALSLTIETVIDVTISSDPDEPERRVLQLDRPSFSVSRKDLVANETDIKAAAIRDAYTNFVKAGLKLYEPEMNVTLLDETCKRIVALQVALAKLAASDEDRRNMSQILKRFKVQELADEIKGINLTSIVKGLLGPVEVNEVLIADLNYLKQLGQLLDANTDVMGAYHTWQVIDAFGSFLSEKFTEAQFAFRQVKTGVKKKPNQEDLCIKVLVEYLPSVIGRVYIDASNFTDSDKEGVREIIRRMKNSKRRSIEQKQWMDEETKRQAIEKLIKMKEFIGYPNWIKNDTLLTKYFTPELTGVNDSSYSLWMRVMQFLKNRALDKLNGPVDLDYEWPMSPALVNAAYGSERNRLTFPAAHLRGVFYQQDSPDYCNYAGIGATIGHEINHAFDDEGSQFDAHGTLKNWWSESSLANFTSLTKQVVKQYSEIIDETTGLNLNGENTVGENIADDGGLRDAYSAVFESGNPSRNQLLPGLELFTPEQLFFVVYANSWCSVVRPEKLRQQIKTDEHSPTKYRVNVPLMNNEKFSDAFSCPTDSPMNPSHKVRVW